MEIVRTENGISNFKLYGKRLFGVWPDRLLAAAFCECMLRVVQHMLAA